MRLPSVISIVIASHHLRSASFQHSKLNSLSSKGVVIVAGSSVKPSHSNSPHHSTAFHRFYDRMAGTVLPLTVGNGSHTTMSTLSVASTTSTSPAASLSSNDDAISKFVAQPHIQAALADPTLPRSVLSFFFGADYHKSDDVHSKLLLGGCICKDMYALWYNGGPSYDEICQPFASMIRIAGKQQFDIVFRDDDDDDEVKKRLWTSTVDGAVAQVILCDQLSRNVFRGTAEAYAYDDVALLVAKQLTTQMLNLDKAALATEIPMTNNNMPLEGVIYPAYMIFLVTCFMHSESIADHELAVQVIDYAQREYSTIMVHAWQESQTFLDNHTQVLRRFGRYPHRNKMKGRENTPEEEMWLNDVDNLPGWAKS
jgi:uncharacterized protein (DUF924 family)